MRSRTHCCFHLLAPPAGNCQLNCKGICSFDLLQGYMMKKGHKRKNWTERWFLLKPNLISYYVSEDLTEKKGDILLDGNCCVEVRAQRIMIYSKYYFSLAFTVSNTKCVISMVTSFSWIHILFLLL